MRVPGQHLTQSSCGLELCGQSPQEVQGFVGINGALQRELLHQSTIYRWSHHEVRTNLEFPSWDGENALVIPAGMWRMPQ